MATRRDFLKAASLLAGGAGMAGVIPESVKRAFIVFLLSRCDRSQHQRVGHLDLCGVWEQVVVDPAAEDRCLHRNGPRLEQSLHPQVQLAAGRSNLAFLLYPATHVLHAVADRLLVYVQSDVIHMSSRSLRGCSLNQRRR
jgi:hypothetical protein